LPLSALRLEDLMGAPSIRALPSLRGFDIEIQICPEWRVRIQNVVSVTNTKPLVRLDDWPIPERNNNIPPGNLGRHEAAANVRSWEIYTRADTHKVSSSRLR